jgi:hypothetical protein
MPDTKPADPRPIARLDEVMAEIDATHILRFRVDVNRTRPIPPAHHKTFMHQYLLPNGKTVWVLERHDGGFEVLTPLCEDPKITPTLDALRAYAASPDPQ